jgi:hypothetical protein
MVLGIKNRVIETEIQIVLMIMAVLFFIDLIPEWIYHKFFVNITDDKVLYYFFDLRTLE